VGAVRDDGDELMMMLLLAWSFGWNQLLHTVYVRCQWLDAYALAFGLN
jgi:hypothetical protein